MVNSTGFAGPCASHLLQDYLFPYMSAGLFGLLALSSAVGAGLVLARRQQIRNAWLRSATFALMFSACCLHVAIGLVHGILGLVVGDTTYNRLQNSYFVALTLAVSGVNLLLILQAPRSTWRFLASLFTGASCLLAVCLAVVVIVNPNLWIMRTVWTSMDAATLLAAIAAIQAASLSSRHVREIALLTATAATFVLRLLPEMAVAIYLISMKDRHLGFDDNSLYEMFLEIFPSVLFLTLMWPRKNVLQLRQATRAAGGRVEQFLREKGLSVAILVFFYLFIGFVFVNGVLSTCNSFFGQSEGIGWSYYISNGASRVLAEVVPLLLFTVMFGSMTFLKSTVLRIAVPFDDAILWHLHVAGVFVVAAVTHCASSVLMGYDADFDLMPWASGGVALGLGCIAFLAGVLYWISTRTAVALSWFMFPQFVWIHRVGYLMILVAYPVHIWSSIVANPADYIVTYAVFLIFLIEIVWRVTRVAKSSEATMRPISRDLFWLDVSIVSSRRIALYRSGQWVYLTAPGVSLLERHPFTIAAVKQAPHDAAMDTSINEEDRLLPGARSAGNMTVLSFLIKKQSGRGARSWTARLLEQLQAHQAVSIFVDGPFSSPAMNVSSSSVKYALLLGVGSGITAPLGISAGLNNAWTRIVFVTRDPAQVTQVARAIGGIVESDGHCLKGGAVLFLTVTHFEWPHLELLRGLMRQQPWAELRPLYEQFVQLAHNAFGAHDVPVVDTDRLGDFVERLRAWTQTHDFMRPSERVEVRLGRPDWRGLIEDTQAAASVSPDTRSFLPSRELDNLNDVSNTLLELHLMYCGPRGPLGDVEGVVSSNNAQLYVHGGHSQSLVKYHIKLHEEVF